MAMRAALAVLLLVSFRVVLATVLPLGRTPVQAAPALRYEPPVDAPVTDSFRAPDGPYGAGNRGLEYETVPGAPVQAVADGVVAFAGPVAGRLVVSVQHPDGLRSSLTGMATLAVVTGAEVRGGQALGTAARGLHLGIRRGETYLDPASLFVVSTGSGSVRLVPADGPLGGAEPPPPAAPSVDGRRMLSAIACPPACKPGERP